MTSSAARTTRRFGACALALAATSAAAAAQASAATITITTPCVRLYSQAVANAGVPISGSGFTPGDDIDLTGSPGDAFGSATADANGNFTTTFSPSTVDPSKPVVSTFTMTAADTGSNVTASAPFQEVPLAVATKPARAKPGTIVTFAFSGFTPGQPIYGHYLHKKKVVATKKFGTATGACGTLSDRSSFFPGREKYNTYKVQFDDAKKYSKTSSPSLPASLSKTFL